MRAESLRLTSLVEYVGSDRLCVSRTVVDELSQTRFDDKRGRYSTLISPFPVLDDETDAVLTMAETLFAKYDRHDDPPDAADLVIAATAADSGQIVVTENWRDFHFIEEIRLLDIRQLTLEDLPVLANRSPVQGAIDRSRGCCRRLVRDLGLTP